MALSSKLARPFLASIFVVGGVDALRHPEGKVKEATKVTEPLSRQVSFVPENTVLLVRINGGVQVAAATALALGRFRRLAALALLGSLVPTTYAGHAFWNELDEEQKSQQLMQFTKNAAIAGGLLLAITDTEGAPSASWRVKRQLRRAGSGVRRAKKTNSHKAQDVISQASDAGGQLLRRLDDAVAQGVAKGSDVASHSLTSGVQVANTLAQRAQEVLAS
jgi:putative oxidoreductase